MHSAKVVTHGVTAVAELKLDPTDGLRFDRLGHPRRHRRGRIEAWKRLVLQMPLCLVTHGVTAVAELKHVALAAAYKRLEEVTHGVTAVAELKHRPHTSGYTLDESVTHGVTAVAELKPYC